MRLFRRRRKVNTEDFKIIEIKAGMLSVPEVVFSEPITISVPTFPTGTIPPAVVSISGVFPIRDPDEAKSDEVLPGVTAEDGLMAEDAQ